MKRYISVVTGGAGFIGSHLVDLLISKGHIVRVVDNLVGGQISNLSKHLKESNLVLHETDILRISPNESVFSGAKYIFHLAGIGDIVPSIENPSDYFQTNIQGTVNILEAARFNNVKKFVYAASSSCYGLASTPTSETASINPLYPYAMSKYLGEVAAFHWYNIYKLPVNSICIFNAYGVRAKTTGAYGAVIGVFMRQKISNTPFTVVGNGMQTRDFVYVTDVAEAFYLAAKTDLVGERFNVGSGKPISINRIVELLDGEAIYIPKRPGEPDSTFADIKKISNLLNWSPKISF
jgi:UDP-glucose 4-epimerase